MEKGIKKISYKVLTLVLCLCIVSGAVAPAYAVTTNADSAASKLFDLYWYTGSNPSGQNGTWYGVVRILLKNIYDRLESVWSDQRNLWTYNSTSYSLWNFSNNSNLSQSYYISNGAGPVSWLLNSMANLSQNTGYVANQFYNSNSNFNKAMSAMVSLNSNFQDYSSVLNSIKSNTDNLSGIKTDTANLSGIKTDTANLSDIKIDTANLSGIKTDTASISSNTENILSRIDNYTKTVFRYLSKNGTYDAELTYNEIGANNVPYYTYSNGSPRVLYTGAANIGLQGYLDVLNKNLVSVGNLIHENYSFYTVYSKDNNGNYNAISRYNYSLMDVLQNINVQFGSMLSAINFVIADPDTIAAKIANKNNESAVLTNFTGSGSASATPSDFGAVKDSIVDFKSGFSGGASSSDTFSFISGDSNAWDWFTQDTANDVDRTQRNNTRLLRSSSDVASDTPLLDSYYTSILSILGGDE